MRLAILSPYTDPIRGGISTYTRELAAAYRDLGIQTIGLAREGDANLQFEVVPGSKIAFCIRSALRSMKWKADVVHAHSHWYTLASGLVVKLLRPQTRVLFTFHTPPTDAEPIPGALRRARIAIFLALLRFCDGVAFVSRETQEMLNLPTSLHQALVQAAPERLFNESHRHAGSARPVILAVSVMTWPRKVAGLLMLIDAFATVAPGFPGWRLVIVGDGPLRAKLEERVSNLGLGEKVQLKGFVKNVHAEMVLASVFTQISLQEGLPITILNAMALGLPVIATAVGGMPDVVQDRVTGYIVNPSMDDVSKALEDLLGNPELRTKIGDAAKVWVNKELSWERVARKGLKLVGETPQ